MMLSLTTEVRESLGLIFDSVCVGFEALTHSCRWPLSYFFCFIVGAFIINNLFVGVAVELGIRSPGSEAFVATLYGVVVPWLILY